MGYEFRERFNRAADALTNWPVVVRLRKPYLKGVGGLMTVAEGGYAVIDLDPDRPIAAIYESFLHEVAHVKLHAKGLKKTNDHKLKPGAEVLTRAEWEADRANPLEAQADALADSWAAWAAKEVECFIEPGYPDEVIACMCLKALETI